MRLDRAALAAFATALALAPAAQGATARVDEQCDKYDCVSGTLVDAAPGELNRMTLADTAPAGGVVLHDDGAPLTAGAGCVQQDERTVVCGNAQDDQSAVYVDAGDGKDVVDARAFGYTYVGLRGGPGDDRLEVANVESEVTGGPGADVLAGHGAGTASYADHKEAVTVDLGAGTGGAAGERDRLEGIRRVIGGRGDDLMFGTGEADELSGGAGDDRLAGGAGDDQLAGGKGADLLDGGAGDDKLSPAGPVPGAAGIDRPSDRLRCGPGRDLVSEVDRPDLVMPGCEQLNVQTGPIADIRLLLPLRSAGGALLRMREDCNCTLRIVVRRARDGRVLGRLRRRFDGKRSATVTLRLSPRGRAALRRGRPLSVRIEVSEFRGAGSVGGFRSQVRVR